ncbi:MAG: DUF58 domain-containing protein [Chloroflexi bacterium]|nr:DUF58 domain-containing protein [Chloroflexota bacterium]
MTPDPMPSGPDSVRQPAFLEITSPLPVFPGTKDVRFHPIFRGAFSRWGWSIYTQRLTQAGRWFFWPSVLFLAYGGSSLEMQAYVPFCYTAALWGVAIVIGRMFRPRVRVTTHAAERVCAGEIMPVELDVESRGWLPATDLVILPDRLPLAVDAAPAEGAALSSLARGEKCRARLGLHCKKRGLYRLRGFRVETDFPFGVWRSYQRLVEDRPLMVYPQFTRLHRLQIPTGRRYHPGGVAMASALGDSFEFIGNREYRQGDSIRDIDWRATARLNTPIVREFREEYFLRVAVILDTHVPVQRGAEGKRSMQAARASFERAVSLCAAVSDHMARQEYLVDILAAGPNLYHLTAGRSLAYLDQILDILACVEENPAEPFEVIEPELMESLAQITTIICIFVDWNEARRAFVDRLSQQGAGLKIMIARDSPCTLDPAVDAPLFGPIPVVSADEFQKGIVEL